MKGYSYDFYKASADYILERLPEKPQVALILGSSLGSLAVEIEYPGVIDY